ncbi:3D (Asp-Asp-Asp) domain-containing protein [Robiginitalea myxolifaciens]|uniref:3D (Asp-Asp-Asp) domain-containing protein n=1 Tax=Robiginitalea myxolifaciens TaxID=400055 RepID=A0A1I6H0P4_9FLAO|nr:3D domain-containing protein [Robiginitalea myxolifaciens]SFR48036.1 3D (Asp-Asp-Asp) domain-containing protein [Robiginitalea myxolifaciens]
MYFKSIIPSGLLLLFFLNSCQPDQEYVWQEIEVTVSAFNSVPWQTDGDPTITAWGDTLQEGMQCIAISRDLLAIGLEHNTEVEIEGLPGTYLVKDKMNRRFRNHVDLYMGTDVSKAREWGRQKRIIRFKVPDTTSVK